MVIEPLVVCTPVAESVAIATKVKLVAVALTGTWTVAEAVWFGGVPRVAPSAIPTDGPAVWRKLMTTGVVPLFALAVALSVITGPAWVAPCFVKIGGFAT